MEAAIEEGDWNDKKARINKKVIPDLYNNVILACTLIGEFDRADDRYSASLRLDLANRDENNLKELKLLNDDLRERHQVTIPHNSLKAILYGMAFCFQ